MSDELFGSGVKRMCKLEVIRGHRSPRALVHFCQTLVNKHIVPADKKLVLNYYDSDLEQFILLDAESWSEFVAQAKKQVSISTSMEIFDSVAISSSADAMTTPEDADCDMPSTAPPPVPMPSASSAVADGHVHVENPAVSSVLEEIDVANRHSSPTSAEKTSFGSALVLSVESPRLRSVKNRRDASFTRNVTVSPLPDASTVLRTSEAHSRGASSIVFANR